ncbi:MAG TPA: hypothetical protein VN715_08430 [Roseiarcus sp.]|nr:hypothetical protein [Roseiarcus sp.]
MTTLAWDKAPIAKRHDRAAHRCIRIADEVGGIALLIEANTERAARW